MKRLLYLGMLLWCTRLQAQDLSKVLAQVPESANVLTVIDTRSLLQTPKANKEGWKERRNLDYLAGKVAFPPNASFVVVASDYNFAERRNDWQIGLFDFPSKIYEDRIAQREGSNVELIENLYVIPSRRNMYFVQFERERYATYSPANRQKLTNWIRFAKSNKESKVNPYLADAVIRGGQDGQINVAVDLQQTLDRVEVIRRLQASKTVTDAGVDRTQLSNLIMSIRGIRFSIRVTDLSLAQLHVDFNENIGEFDKVLPGLLAETLESNGFHGTDVTQWQTSTRGKTFTARGPIDDDEAKRIMFMVLPSTVEPARQPWPQPRRLISGRSPAC
ncbi:MAG TPA: hypothetical protein PKD72_15435 [Gemmatales bacterium]|nr:hypothetical protein [Gemmatales bacterium]